MTAAEKAYTAEYSYVAPSVYARELAGQLPERDRGAQGTKTGRRESAPADIRVIPGTKEQSPISGIFLRRAVAVLLVAGILAIAFHKGKKKE